ncbi:MAG: tetratricopeptide repeat protein [Desulfobacteraceae bacterium]|nr:tetratricopeptide repeat protein [Desulfobacteraceae bacterium]
MAGSADRTQTYWEMLQLDPRSRVFSLLAESLCAEGKWEEAAKVCTDGLQYHPTHTRARVLLGWALMELGEADRSEAVLLEVQDEMRKNAIAFKFLSEFAEFSGDPGRAEEFSRIYNAFQAGPDAAPILQPQASIKSETVAESGPEPLAAPVQGIAPAHFDAPPPPEPAQVEPACRPDRTARLKGMLAAVADGLESRALESKAAPAVISQEDRNLLKKLLLSRLEANGSPS